MSIFNTTNATIANKIRGGSNSSFLSKAKTVIRYIEASWINSKFIKQQAAINRPKAFLSLLYWFYFYGHDFNDYCTFRFWEKSDIERKAYISLRRNDVLRFKLSTPEVHKLFLDKAVFNHRFSRFVNRKWILPRQSSDSEIIDFISKNENVIAKPLKEFGGHGIEKLSAKDISPDDLTPIQRFREQDYIIEECIENHTELKRLAPGSLNTIRVVTIIDKQGKNHILAALLRMGNGKSFTDNYHDGGMACTIDIETGRLRGNAFGMSCTEYERHPHSGIKFEGYKIPHFKQCMTLIEELVKVEPQARYVGWDLAITPNGIELLEGNIPPGEDITQIAAGRGLWHEVNEMI